jgi:hypothetical protein
MLPAGGPSPNPLDARLLAAVTGLTLAVGAALFVLPPTAEPPLPRQVAAAAAASGRRCRGKWPQLRRRWWFGATATASSDGGTGAWRPSKVCC